MNQRVIYLGLIVCFVLVFTQPLFSVEKTEPFTIGDTIPDLELYSAEGIPVSFRPPEGKFLWILFWNPNEEASVEWIQDKLRLYNRFHGSGLNALGICVGVDEDKAVSFSRIWNILWPLVVEKESDEKPAETLGVKTFPYDVLIDSQGIVQALNLNGLEAHKIVPEILGFSLDDFPLEEAPRDWKEKFYQVYRLQENENLKRIAPPFIPERMEYYKVENTSQAMAIPNGPNLMLFRWDGTLKKRGMVFSGDQITLKDVLSHPLRLTQFEIEGPEDLLSIHAPGDWIVREGVSQADLLSALETILREELGQSIRIVLRNVERDVIIASGQFKYQPISFQDANEENTIHVFADPNRIRTSGGWGNSGSLGKFIRDLSNHLNHIIINETGSSDVETRWRFRQAYFKSDPDTLESFLKSVSEQTSLEFRREKRLVPIWFVERDEDSKPETKEKQTSIEVGETIPALQTTSVMGLPVSFRAPEGKHLWILFWKPNEEASEEWIKDKLLLYNRFHGSGLNAVGVCVGSDENEAVSFSQIWRVLWPLIVEDESDEKPAGTLGVKSFPYDVLIDSKGKVLALNLTGLESHETMAKILGVSLDDLPLENVPRDWREKFYQVYRLKKDENLKRIATPFIPERMEYYRTKHSSQAESIPRGPRLMVFHWDGTLKNWGMSFGGDQAPLKFVLTFPLGLTQYEFEGPEDLLSINAPGDWIVRTGVSQADLLSALETILREELGQSIRFVQRKVEREIIVASGRYKYSPLSFQDPNRDTIHVFADPTQIHQRSGGGGAAVAHWVNFYDPWATNLTIQLWMKLNRPTSIQAGGGDSAIQNLSRTNSKVF